MNTYASRVLMRCGVSALLLGLSVTGLSTQAVAQDDAPYGANKRDRTYVVSEERSQLYVQVYHQRGTIGSGFAHDHVIRAGKLSGELRFDPRQPRTCSLDLAVPARGLVVDEPKMRRKVGYEEMLDNGDRQTVREHMLDDDQLAAGEHPTLRFRASDCRPVAGKDDVYKVRLAVTVRGKTKTRPVNVRIRAEGGQLMAHSAFNMKHADFDMEPYSAMLGAVKVAQPIRFVADLVAREG